MMTDVHSSSTTNLVNGDMDCGVASGRRGRRDVRHTYYTLPAARYTNLVRSVLLVDGVVAAVLWLTGGEQGGLGSQVGSREG